MKEGYIKYVRIVEAIPMNNDFDQNLQNFLKGLVTEDIEILYYNEEVQSIIHQMGLDSKTENTLKITIFGGVKRQVL